MTKPPLIYLVLAGAVVLFLVIGAILVTAKAGLVWPAIALAAWLAVAGGLAIAWFAGREGPSGRRRFAQLRHDDAVAARLIVKVVIGALVLAGVAVAAFVAR